MIRTLAQNWTPMLFCSADIRKVLADTASDGLIIIAVQTSYNISLLFCHQNQSLLSLKAVYDKPG
jgi:hypothetical protein